jgi:hypothetical protein
VGLGRESVHGPRFPSAGLSRDVVISAVGLDRTAAHRFRRYKKADPAVLNPNPSSPFSFSCPVTAAATAICGRRGFFAGGGRRRRREPPRRRACSPTAEHAAVEWLHGRFRGAPARKLTEPAARRADSYRQRPWRYPLNPFEPIFIFLLLSRTG